MAERLKDQPNPHEIKLKDLKIVDNEQLSFTEEPLQELSEQCVRLHVGKYLQYL